MKGPILEVNSIPQQTDKTERNKVQKHISIYPISTANFPGAP